MFSIKPPSLLGEIKKARASNYTWDRSICELIDNSRDVLVNSNQQKKNILIKFNYDSNNNLISISCSDNYNKGITDHNIWNWTYDNRYRGDGDCGEFGTGFKSGSVNISSELVIITSTDGKYNKMRADWNEMAEHDTYTPTFETIDKELYNKYHPFTYGSTFILKNMIHTNIPADPLQMKNELIYKIKTVYKKLLKQHKNLSIKVDDTIINYINVPNEIFSRKIHPHEIIPHSKIHVFMNKQKEIITIVEFINGGNTEYVKINFKEGKPKRNANGNIYLADARGALRGASAVDISVYNNKDDYVFKDSMSMNSRCIYHLCKPWIMNDEIKHEDESHDPNGYINLIRKDRTLSDKCSAIHYRGDGYATYMYHELTYNNRLMDNPLGVQFNKNTDNKIQSENLEAAISWVQKRHESVIDRFEEKSGHGHKRCMDAIENKYNQMMKKNKNNNLQILFDIWTGQVNWINYNKRQHAATKIQHIFRNWCVRNNMDDESTDEEDINESTDEDTNTFCLRKDTYKKKLGEVDIIKNIEMYEKHKLENTEYEINESTDEEDINESTDEEVEPVTGVEEVEPVTVSITGTSVTQHHRGVVPNSEGKHIVEWYYNKINESNDDFSGSDLKLMNMISSMMKNN